LGKGLRRLPYPRFFLFMIFPVGLRINIKAGTWGFSFLWGVSLRERHWVHGSYLLLVRRLQFNQSTKNEETKREVEQEDEAQKLDARRAGKVLESTQEDTSVTWNSSPGEDERYPQESLLFRAFQDNFQFWRRGEVLRPWYSEWVSWYGR